MLDFQIKVDANNVVREVSDTLFGIFLEDINYACDGGLNANMVNNHSFDGIYMENKGSIRMWTTEGRYDIYA